MAARPPAVAAMTTPTTSPTVSWSTGAKLAATGAGAFALGALIGYNLLRRRMLARDSPPAPANPTAYFEKLLQEQDARRARRAAGGASAAASAGAGSALISASDLEFRVPVAADAHAITEQVTTAFDGFNASVGMSSEFGSFEFALSVLEGAIQNDQAIIAVRKSDGKVMGSVFNDENDIEDGAVGCGPWSARWGELNSGVGGELVRRIVAQSLRHGARSLRLIQIGANNTSFSLYSSLGFVVREPLMAWRGWLRPEFIESELARTRALGFTTRQMVLSDVAAANRLHEQCNGISRLRSLQNDVSGPYLPACVVAVFDERQRLVGYITGLGAMQHAVATSMDAMKALYAAAHAGLVEAVAEAVAAGKPNPALAGAYQHTSLRLYPELTQWMIAGGMRAYRQVNLMVLGEWQPIAHERFVYSPSISY